MCLKTLPEFRDWWGRTGRYLSRDPKQFESSLLLAFRGGQASREEQRALEAQSEQNDTGGA